MAKTKLEKYRNVKTIGYWSALNGIEIKDIEYGIDDYVICISNAWSGGIEYMHYHRLKVCTDNKDGRPYVRLCGSNYYLDEAVRCT